MHNATINKIPYVHTGASAVITSDIAGSGAVIIAGAANRFPYVLFVTDQIKSVEELKGKKFGVSRMGSADNAAAVTVLQRYGIKESDVTYVKAGSIPARLAAMQSNALQATLLQAPETLKAKELGMRALLDFTKLDGSKPVSPRRAATSRKNPIPFGAS
jgi:ABC-type nitrate/sulfonate/bicarbonate transport system substrate-binding protein